MCYARMAYADPFKDSHFRWIQYTNLLYAASLIGMDHENGVVEEEYWTLVALAVLAENPHQENVLWRGFQWRLYATFRRLNQATRPFYSPIPRCEDAVE